MRFVIDEDLPRSLGPALQEAGHEVLDVRDHGLRGASDQQVFTFAQARQAVLVSEDLGFANLLRFPLNSHHGLIVGRFPTTLATSLVVREIVRALGTLTPADVSGALVIIETGRIRRRGAE